MRHSYKCIAVAFLFFSLIMQRPLCADEVTRLSKKSAEKGKVTKTTRTEVVLKPRSGADIKIPVNDVVSFKFDDEPPGLSLARAFEKKGSLQRALDGYLKAKQAYKGANKGLESELDFLIARVSSMQAKGDSARIDNAIGLLERFRKANDNHIRFFESTALLSGMYVKKNDAAKAREVAAELSSAPIVSYKMKAAIIKGQSFLAENQIGKATTEFESVAGMGGTTPAAKFCLNEAALGRATCLHRSQKFDEAVRALADVIDKSAGDPAVLAEAFLRQGDCYRDQNKPRDALFSYLHVDLLFSSQKSQHAEALYNLGQLWAKTHPDRATEARARLTQEYPNTSWATK